MTHRKIVPALHGVVALCAAMSATASQAQIRIGEPAPQARPLIDRSGVAAEALAVLRADYHSLVDSLAAEIVALLRQRGGAAQPVDPAALAEWRGAQRARIADIAARAGQIAAPSPIDGLNIGLAPKEKGSQPAALVAEARTSIGRSITAAKPSLLALVDAVAAARAGDEAQRRALPALYYDTVVLMLEDRLLSREIETKAQPPGSERYWLAAFKQADAGFDLALAALRRNILHGRPADKAAAIATAQARIEDMRRADQARAQRIRRDGGRLPAAIRGQANAYFERSGQYQRDTIAAKGLILDAVSADPAGAPALERFNPQLAALNQTGESLDAERRRLLLDAMAL